MAVTPVYIGLILLLGLLPGLAAQSPDIESVKTIKLSGPAGKRLDHMALDAKRDRLFVANTANSSLDIVDLKQEHVEEKTCTVCGCILLDAGELRDLSEFTLREKLGSILSKLKKK